MRIFLAGATGVIGRVLIPLLVEAGHDVTGMTRSAERAPRLEEQGARAVVCDALDPTGLEQAVVSARPEIVIHQLTEIPARMDARKAAAQLGPTNRLRREGTRNLIAAARTAGARRVIAQSIAFAYELSGDWIKDEDAPLDADSPYGEAVAAIADLERQVTAADGIVLRYGYFYGPGTQFESDGLYGELVRRRRLPIVGSGEGRWSFIHVEDAAAATVAALTRGSPGIYNIVDDDPARARDWIPLFAAALGAKPPFRVPGWLGRLVGGRVAVASMTQLRGASNAKARRELNWTPARASWREELRRAGGAAELGET
jgi:nucleoside-diphosphate-sugar epimerase